MNKITAVWKKHQKSPQILRAILVYIWMMSVISIYASENVTHVKSHKHRYYNLKTTLQLSKLTCHLMVTVSRYNCVSLSKWHAKTQPCAKTDNSKKQHYIYDVALLSHA